MLFISIILTLQLIDVLLTYVLQHNVVKHVMFVPSFNVNEQQATSELTKMENKTENSILVRQLKTFDNY